MNVKRLRLWENIFIISWEFQRPPSRSRREARIITLLVNNFLLPPNPSHLIFTFLPTPTPFSLGGILSLYTVLSNHMFYVASKENPRRARLVCIYWVFLTWTIALLTISMLLKIHQSALTAEFPQGEEGPGSTIDPLQDCSVRTSFSLTPGFVWA